MSLSLWKILSDILVSLLTFTLNQESKAREKASKAIDADDNVAVLRDAARDDAAERLRAFKASLDSRG